MIQILTNGFIDGVLIGMFAWALVLIRCSVRIFPIEMAGLFSAAPYIVWSLWKTPWAPAWGISISLATCIGFCLLCYLNHRRLEEKRATPELHFISSLGIAMILTQIIAMVWANEAKSLNTNPIHLVPVGSLQLSYPQIASATISSLLLLILGCWQKFSKYGSQLTAMQFQADKLALFGAPVRFLQCLAFLIAGLLVGTSSLLTAWLRDFTPHGGYHAVLLAFLAVAIGGEGKWIQLILASIGLGVFRALIGWQLSQVWADLASIFLLLGCVACRQAWFIRVRNLPTRLSLFSS